LSAALPREAGRPRTQRLVDALHPVHLEAEIPTPAAWNVTVEGLVEHRLRLSLPELAALPVSQREIDFHCVWGWSRRACRWEGVSGADLLEACRPLEVAACARFSTADGPYSSCIHLDDVADGILAWKLDGEPLRPEHGGPLRFVPPARLWGYKGVKWLRGITFVDSFSAGFWERKIGDEQGRVPDAVLELFER
jgi:DMSO/TMAO reductase YedYZ molybdopterin-dependent catalytic subunit